MCIRIRNSFLFEWLCTRTRFETEANSNSEVGYCLYGLLFIGRLKRVLIFQEDDNIPLRILLLLMDEIFDLKHR